jgi:CRISPR system Cascade subunit CasE
MTLGPNLLMSRLEPDMARAARWGTSNGVVRPGTDDGYFWHALLKAVFGDLALRPFRVIEPERRRPYLLGYGAADKAALLTQAEAFASPDAVEAIGLSSLAVKTMPASFAVGTRLGFEVRVRPITRTTRNDPINPAREIDVFLAAVHKAPPQEKLDRGAVYSGWLARELEKGGAAVDLKSVRLVAVRRSRLLRRGKADDKGHRPLLAIGTKGGGPDLLMAGRLTVADPAAFSALLARGVGRHRAFGFGMLLLKPPAPAD